MMRIIPFLLPLLAGACVTSGVGTGTLTSARVGKEPISIGWNQIDDTSGTLAASLPDGSVLSGKYVQIVRNIDQSKLNPLWVGWDEGWTSWPYANGTAAQDDFVKLYTGRVVGVMQDETGKRLRCRFVLNDPSRGMAGGGRGECQGRDGTTLHATFPSE